MNPPFSKDQFFQSLVAYNATFWPIQVLLVVLAIATLALAYRRERWGGKAITAIIGFLWVWMGIAYHWAFFAEINPAARVFGGVFILEGFLLFRVGFRREDLSFDPQRNAFSLVGGSLILYALVIYPLLGFALGHRYPAQPTFGLPCPTTIFTVGLLLWARPKIPWILLIIPLLWFLIGMTAVRFFGVLADAMLPVATIAGGALILLKNRRYARQSVAA